MSITFNPHAARVQKAKLQRRLGKTLPKVALILTFVLVLAAVFFYAENKFRLAEILAGLAILSGCKDLWLRWDIGSLKPKQPNDGVPLEAMLEAGLAARLPWPASPKAIWDACLPDWRASFMLVRLGIHPELIGPTLNTEPTAGEAVWTEAIAMAKLYDAQDLNAGLIVAAIIKTEPKLSSTLSQLKLKLNDVEVVYRWLERWQPK
jgi:hypothetical protein